MGKRRISAFPQTLRLLQEEGSLTPDGTAKKEYEQIVHTPFDFRHNLLHRRHTFAVFCYSRIFEVIKSTPHEASFSAVSGSSTVQQLTLMPLL